jgi:beta-lactamase class A
MPQPPHKTISVWYKNPYPWVVVVVASAAAFAVGWLIPHPVTPAQSLRLSGYQFIDPLLACNVNNSRTFPEDQSLSNDIQSVVNQNIQAGNISKAGVYFVDLSNGKWADVDPTSQFYPSSLGKIPIMIAYYEMAENNPAVLNQTITYTGGPDLNDTQDIKPAAAIVPGQTYTVDQLIEYMIEDSDNNATQLLYSNVDQTALQNIYNDLGIPVINDVTEADADAVTPQQISLLFRVLYNSTYLSRDYSEKALELMSHSSFIQGIVAGVPSSTVVAHKLGLVGITSGGVTTEHELHDCGIVYANDPYVLCVMTRGTAPLPTMESIIAQISSVAYQHVENGQ